MCSSDLIPDEYQHLAPRPPRQVQVENDQVGTIGLLFVESLNETDGAVAVGNKQKLAGDAVFFEGLAHQTGIGGAIFD